LPVPICLDADLPDHLTSHGDELRNALLYASVHSPYFIWRLSARDLIKRALMNGARNTIA
jgi:hypothetical protein